MEVNRVLQMQLDEFAAAARRATVSDMTILFALSEPDSVKGLGKLAEATQMVTVMSTDRHQRVTRAQAQTHLVGVLMHTAHALLQNYSRGKMGLLIDAGDGREPIKLEGGMDLRCFSELRGAGT